MVPSLSDVEEAVFLLCIQPKEVAEGFAVIFAGRASEAKKATVLSWVGGMNGGEEQTKTAAVSWCSETGWWDGTCHA